MMGAQVAVSTKAWERESGWKQKVGMQIFLKLFENRVQGKAGCGEARGMGCCDLLKARLQSFELAREP